jgi:hypothetical protein
VRRPALGDVADDSAHRQDEQPADDENRSDEKDVAPGQFPQEAQMVIGLVHGIAPWDGLVQFLTMLPWQPQGRGENVVDVQTGADWSERQRAFFPR